ncbi:MAG: FAD/NAD(P)-binding protein [Actinomycetota bacterium]|nr:FAD/NAD(P)-binding protein [Actinomycetota bacterium]
MSPDTFLPQPAVIKEIRAESSNVATYTLAFVDEKIQSHYRFEPGQYNMVGLPGIGEAPISISSSPDRRDAFDHTVRIAGRVTTALSRLAIGDTVGLRGPYGHPWPLDELRGKDVAVIVGGTGCACIKPAINILTAHRDEFRSATILYGAKTAPELLFADEFDRWRDRGVDVYATIDSGNKLDWPFHVGVVTTLFDRLKPSTDRSAALMSGPDIMMRFCVVDLLKRGWSPGSIWLSLERRMDCAVRMCGHCQLGPKYVCQDGPVFNYEEVEDVFGVVA